MIYFIFGSDTYRSKEKLNELIKKHSVGFELYKIDGERIKADEFKNKINSLSIFTKKRLIIIENLSVNKEQKEITDWLKNKFKDQIGSGQTADADTIDDVLIFYEEKINKVALLYKFLQKNTECFEFGELKLYELKKWAQNYIKKNKGKIDAMALEELLMGSNNNLWFLSRELDKLLAYNKHITLENVQLLTPANFDDNIFNLTDAIGRGNKIIALELINKQLDSGAAPIYLLSMIIRQFRILLQVKEETEKQKFLNYSFIAKELGLHPFVVQKSINQTKKYSFEELEKIYQHLQELDLKLKSSKLSPESLFALMIVK